MSKSIKHPFHYRAISWLREKMSVNTRVLPTDAVADTDHPDRARLSGYVLPEDYNALLGYLALMLMLCAGTIAMASARAGIDPGLVEVLRIGAGGTTGVAILLLVADNWRERHLARNVDVVVQGNAAELEAVDAAHLELWHRDAKGQLWVISERGFTSDALELARERSIRCFAVRKHWIEEITNADAPVSVASLEAA